MPEKLRDEQKIRQDPASRKARDAGQRTGVANTPLDEEFGQPELATCETTSFHGDNNTHLIFGRDRPTNRQSGYGGKGMPAAGRIDLIAGLASAELPVPSTEFRNPSFQSDASRLYMSQKADIDRYMGLAAVPTSIDVAGDISAGRSAIGLKSDCIRIHARQDIKIVTGRMRTQGGGSGERLSTGGENEIPGKIYFIAGNQSDTVGIPGVDVLSAGKSGGTSEKIQPVVRGDLLKSMLEEMIDIQASIIQDITDILMTSLMESSSLAAHIHAPAAIVATGPSPSHAPVAGQAAGDLAKKLGEISLKRQRLQALKDNYLSASRSSQYINSYFVFTT